MQRFFKLETILRTAQLGLRFMDLARTLNVSDGLVVTAWQSGTAGPKQVAIHSALTGIYGFHTLPGLQLFAVDGPQKSADFTIAVEDRLERFLPQALLMRLPKVQLLSALLFSSPARLAPASLNAVRGELRVLADSSNPQAAQPAQWALVQATLDAKTYLGMTDARGMFSLFVPYASPPLSLGNAASDWLTRDLSISVFYQARKPELRELGFPDMASIIAQQQQKAAILYDVLDPAHSPSVASSITRPLRFGQELVLKTHRDAQAKAPDWPQLFIAPAPAKT